MDICRQEHLHQIDLLAPAEKKITDREYHVKRRGQKKLDERNRQIAADGLTPRKTVFQTQKDFLRSAIEDVATISNSQEEFQRLLMEKYRITFKNSRGRFSYLHLERSKYITGRMLSTRYEEDYLLKLFEENAKEKEHIKQKNVAENYNTETKASAIPLSEPPQEKLKSIEGKLRATNEQIHYTRQYLANKSVYQQFCKSKNKGQFRKEHSAEISLYETARKFLKEHSADGKAPSMKFLKSEKEQLLQKKTQAQKSYHYYRDYKKNWILSAPMSMQF